MDTCKKTVLMLETLVESPVILQYQSPDVEHSTAIIIRGLRNGDLLFAVTSCCFLFLQGVCSISSDLLYLWCTTGPGEWCKRWWLKVEVRGLASTYAAGSMQRSFLKGQMGLPTVCLPPPTVWRQNNADMSMCIAGKGERWTDPNSS